MPVRIGRMSLAHPDHLTPNRVIPSGVRAFRDHSIASPFVHQPGSLVFKCTSPLKSKYNPFCSGKVWVKIENKFTHQVPPHFWYPPQNLNYLSRTDHFKKFREPPPWRQNAVSSLSDDTHKILAIFLKISRASRPMIFVHDLVMHKNR